MKHIVTVSEQLFRAIEATSIIRDVPVEHTVDALLREALAARESGETERGRPTATWPPAAERAARQRRWCGLRRVVHVLRWPAPAVPPQCTLTCSAI